MLRVSQSGVVYVCCPSFFKTGGTELLHQLVFELNQKHIKSYITYFGKTSLECINPAFKKYVKEYKTINDIADDEENVLIAPEINIGVLDKYRNIRKCIWWLSVDNYLMTCSFVSVCKYRGILRAIKNVLWGKVPIVKKIEQSSIQFISK